MDPQQELFTWLLTELKKEYTVYDTFLPPHGTPYPFVYLADSRQNDDNFKDAVGGTVSQTIHVWHNNPRKRGTVSQMLLKIKEVCRRLDKTSNFCWLISDVDQRIIEDNSTSVPLLHGVLTIDFKFI